LQELLKIFTWNPCIAGLEKIWNDLAPSRPFNYYLLSDSYADEYKAEKQLGNILLYFTIFAIFIACLGLVGLVSYITVSRTKEIGIRKVLGSGVGEITRMIAADFVKMMLVSIIIASPVAWYIIDLWLDRFAYKVVINFWTFILAGTIAMVMVFVSTGVQSLKAAYKNPIDAIHYE